MEKQESTQSGFEAQYRDYMLKVNFAVGDAKLTTPLDTTIPIPLTVFEYFLAQYRQQKAIYTLADCQIARMRPLFQELEHQAQRYSWRLLAEDRLVTLLPPEAETRAQARSFSFSEEGIGAAILWLVSIVDPRRPMETSAQEPLLKCQQCGAEILADVASGLQSEHMTPPCQYGWESYYPKES